MEGRVGDERKAVADAEEELGAGVEVRGNDRGTDEDDDEVEKDDRGG